MGKELMEQHLLKIITEEIEQRFECKVISISICSIIGTPNVRVKVQFNEDFVWRPNEELGKFETIVFSERSASFFRRVDFFECVKKLSKEN